MVSRARGACRGEARVARCGQNEMECGDGGRDDCRGGRSSLANRPRAQTRERRMIRRVLLISPHFPPDSSAGTHRARLLAPYLSRYGWEPTILTLDPDAYEGQLDHGLPALLPASLRVVRCRAWSAHWTRRIGVGDLGLRSFVGLYREAVRLLRTESFDALFITI